MRKKSFLTLVVVMLAVTLCSCLIACDGNNGGSSFFLGEEGGSNVVSNRINAAKNITFEINSEESRTTQEMLAKIKVVKLISSSSETIKADVRIVMSDENGKSFKVYSPIGGYTKKSYYQITVDNDLTIKGFDSDVKKISFYISKDTTDVMTSNEGVVEVTSADIGNERVVNGVNYFDFNTATSGIALHVNDVVLAIDTAKTYKITSVDPFDGYAVCAYTIPQVEEVYDQLAVTEETDLNKNSEVADLLQEDDLAGLADLAMASFGVGEVNFNIDYELTDDALVGNIGMTIPDVIDNLDLKLEFKITTKLTLNSEISLGALIAAQEQGVDISVTTQNEIEFAAYLEAYEQMQYNEALDEIINKIAALVNDANDDDMKIQLFTWIVPIGNGVASINYEADFVMNFTFSGKLGVKTVSNVDYVTTVNYNPNADTEAGEKLVSGNIEKTRDELSSVSVYADGNFEARIGLLNSLSFKVLGGALSIGVEIELGNYNKFYGSIESNNILEGNVHALYGCYLDGGFYYDIDAVLSIPAISFLANLKIDIANADINLYELGNRYKSLSVYSSDVKVGASATGFTLNGKMKDLVTGATVNQYNTAKITYSDEYLTIADGKITLTEAGVAAQLLNYTVSGTDCDGATYSFTVTMVASETRDANVLAQVNVGTGLKNVTAATLDGTAIDVTYTTQGVVEIAADKMISGNTIVIYANGVSVFVVYVR